MTNLWLDSKKRREKTQINKIRHEKEEITTDNTEIKKNMRILSTITYQQIFNLEEMDNFLETYSLPKLNQEEIDQVNRLVTRNEIEYVIKTLPTYKSPSPDGFTGEFYHTHKVELIHTLLKLFQKLKKKEHSQRHSMRPPSP